MTNRLIHLALLVLLWGSVVCGQDSVGPHPKKARTLEDYRPSTLRAMVKHIPKTNELVPFRVRVVYSSSTRPLSQKTKDVLQGWAECCAGNPDHYTKSYLNEMKFVENGRPYWLAVQDRLISDLRAVVTAGEAIDLFLIRVSALATGKERKSALLVERFQRTSANNDQEEIEWIKSNLPMYVKNLAVEFQPPCTLRITDAVNSASVSKAVFILPLADLDPEKVSVLRVQSIDAWNLSLHTARGKSSILFTLYQGSPAESGSTTSHSLTFRDRQKAEAMAKAFRTAIKLCALTAQED
ncbi:MAG TPA: hypothetical protein VFD48_00805 [Pyrinomonadaceae bacterium]|nr:hypothetical protein [Pyrinomonadaceae bacterium]